MTSENVLGSGELRSTTSPLTSVVSGNKFKNLEVKFSVIGDVGIFEGDIILGTLDELERAKLAADSGVELLGIAVTGRRWPRATVPYIIATTLPKKERVTEAIKHWQSNTKLRFVERNTEKDYVIFQPSDGCSSSVGMQGGIQYVYLGANCTTGNAIHEIGHTIGLWHEQSRADRDQYIEIVWTNIIPNLDHNFLAHTSDGTDIGPYDYHSIMHYPAFAFAKDPSKPTIIPKNGATIGQRTALSPGDIAAANSIY